MQTEMNYHERAALVTLRSGIAAAILMSPDGGDCEFVMLKPCTPTDEEIVSRIQGRGLRSVGVVGFGGPGPHVALNEPLGDSVINALAGASVAWLGVRIETERGDEIEWLKKLWGLNDPRPN